MFLKTTCLKIQKHFITSWGLNEWVRKTLNLQQLLTIFFLWSLSYRKIKTHCAEPFTEYWTCIDYTNLQELRRCRKQQAVFDNCVLEKLGWVRPDLGQLSKVTSYLFDRIARFFSSFLWTFCPDQVSNSFPDRKVIHEFNTGSLWTLLEVKTLVNVVQDCFPRRFELFLDSATYVFALPSADLFLRSEAHAHTEQLCSYEWNAPPLPFF